MPVAIDPGEVDALGEAMRDLLAAVQTLREDPPDPGPARVRAIVALDALTAARKRLANDMVKEMLQHGVTDFAEGPWTIAVRPGRTTVAILDRDAVPPSLCRSIPDTMAVRKHLDKHPETNWASLEQGAPYLEIRSKK